MQDMAPTELAPPMNPLMSDFADLSIQRQQKRKVPKGARTRHSQHVQHRQRASAAASKNCGGSKEEGEGEEGNDESISRISLHQE